MYRNYTGMEPFKEYDTEKPKDKSTLLFRTGASFLLNSHRLVRRPELGKVVMSFHELGFSLRIEP